ncbi:nucleoside hydrolase [Vallitalea pronyensis]|uniref:Nucleoside hydrolase n=1 Tax=Vallitalea pronyensis TaxID=1348613 RepID=A0A8J8MJQ2_9FIRM|nr:nucleoside hydrolase [Vallitalea pronyensis]QUI22761.1 nucleoside hydrolase [Vallitalea pronyensis]
MKEWIILDTDIGGDIDDTWALALLLKMDCYDIKLISITGYDTFYQVQLTAKLLTIAGREDIPIAYNLPQDCNRGAQDRWIEDFSLEHYRGRIYTGTLEPMKKVIHESRDKVKILSIGDKTNVAELLRNHDEAVHKCIVYSMQGSFDETFAETNIRSDFQSARQLLAYDVEKHIIPTDVCGKTKLDGSYYEALLASEDSLVKAVLDNYRIWWEDCDWNEHQQNVDIESSILYDPVTLMYMYDESAFTHEDMDMYVDFNGLTHIESGYGNRVHCATGIIDEEKLKKDMVRLLLE